MTHPFPSPASIDRPRRVFSRFYAWVSERMEGEGMADLRRELLAGLAGEVAAARTAPVPVPVQASTADRPPLADHSVDAGVLCLVMCSLDDRPAALAELIRVLRSGGVLRFLEHTIAETPGLRVAQRVADATVWPLLAGGMSHRY